MCVQLGLGSKRRVHMGFIYDSRERYGVQQSIGVNSAVSSVTKTPFLKRSSPKQIRDTG